MKYEEAVVHRSAIMQDFQDNQNKKLKWPTGGYSDLISAKSGMGYFCVKHYTLLYIHGSAILHFFELRKYHNIDKIQNGH